MSKKRIILMGLLVTFIIVVLIVLFLCAVVFHWANNTEVIMIGKTHFDFVVSSGQVIDYRGFLNITEETKPLKLIDLKTRKRIANYMKKNNLKLKEGHHYFNRVDGTYEEYINDNFKFEKIK